MIEALMVMRDLRQRREEEAASNLRRFQESVTK